MTAPQEANLALKALSPQLSPRASLHLTLRFLGEVAIKDLELVKAECSKIELPPFDLAIQGLGTFRQAGGRQVLWAGLSPSPELESLKKAVDKALAESLGLKPEKRFTPHLTLARLKSVDGDLAKEIRNFTEKPLTTFHVPNFKLYQSKLQPQGAVHTVLSSWPLKNP